MIKLKGKRRIIRWIPGYGITFMEGVVTLPLIILIAMLFLTGLDFKFGVEGSEIHTIPFPKSPVLGYCLVYIVFYKLLPLAIKHRMNRGIVVTIAFFKRRIKGESLDRGTG
jgi:hypothetical protein